MSAGRQPQAEVAHGLGRLTRPIGTAPVDPVVHEENLTGLSVRAAVVATLKHFAGYLTTTIDRFPPRLQPDLEPSR
ncbi:MAG: hypothetical protein J2P28_11950 [Actinobacteria bacterium]|nr:hypothetical protein [Actinomycetota bacterium]MBO0836198.1 hypothetical protein [Actinomycetota bacterium]